MTFPKRLLPLLCLLLILVGCAPAQTAAEPEGLRLWYLSSSESSALGWEVMPAQDGIPDANSLARSLLDGPSDIRLSSPFPAQVTLLDCVLEDGVLSLNLSQEYGALTAAALTAADACLTLTLCQLEEVEAVCTTVDGTYPAGRARHTLSPSDFILLGGGQEPTYVTAVLYFPRLEGRGLGVEHRAVLVPEDSTVSSAIASALLSGPEGDALGAAVPAGTRLLDVSISDRICFVNLSSEFQSDLPERQEDAHLMIYSLVDTLGNLENVDAVQLLINGQALEDYYDIPLSRPLEPDFRMSEE